MGLKIGFWKILKHTDDFVGIVTSGKTLLELVDKDKDGRIELEDLEAWLNAPTAQRAKLVMALLDVLNKVVSIVRIFI